MWSNAWHYAKNSVHMRLPHIMTIVTYEDISLTKMECGRNANKYIALRKVLFLLNQMRAKKKKTKITKTFEFKTKKQGKCVLYVYVALRGVRSIKRLKNLHEL